MAKLAIKGHATKGDEVIKFFKMLGGIKAGYGGGGSQYYYYIDNFGYIIGTTELPNDIIFKVFTLEEFLEKYPHKVGDEVIAYAEGCFAHFTIQGMRWNNKLNKIEYKICSSWCDTSLMQPYKKEAMDKASKDVFDANAQCCDISNKIIKKETMGKEISGAIVHRFICLEGYDFYDDKGNILDTKEITMKKKKPKYPKTYVEVLNFWQPDRQYEDDYQRCYKKDLIEKFQDLLYARDAYWKIAGDWKPNFANQEKKFVIANYYGELCTCKALNRNRVLVFPTEEMRDAFYENFKDLIEECKELL